MVEAPQPDALGSRPSLPSSMLWLRDGLPRDRWADAALPGTARHWLAMHAGFRRARDAMDAAVRDHREARIDVRALHARLIPTLGGFLQHLDGHHRVESGHYFPQFRRIEPRIEAGIDLLDRDHDAIHAELEALAARGGDFHRAVVVGRPADDAAARLAEALDRAGPLLVRHLDDEEDIVIPLLARHGGELTRRGSPPGCSHGAAWLRTPPPRRL